MLVSAPIRAASGSFRGFSRVSVCSRTVMSDAKSGEPPVPATVSTVDRAAIHAGLESVGRKVSAAANAVARSRMPRLVAVSKTKPSEAVEMAYAAGHRHFGENYVQELVDKSPILPPDVRWHFIGALQTNKARALLRVPNLWCVETVDRVKAANALQRAAEDAGRRTREVEGVTSKVEGVTSEVSQEDAATEPLRVMVQVNTSGEDSKAGCAPEEACALARHVVDECPSLRLVGLMTIGALDDSEEPVAFSLLAQCRTKVAADLKLDEDALELSMGMSSDFERAIRMGSDSVRVGSSIFGARLYPKK